MKPDGSPFTGVTQFRVKILTPVEQCVLYDETQTKDLTGSEGLFTLSLNDGAPTNVRNDSNTWSFQQVLSNKSSFAVASSLCQSGSGTVTYSPAAADERKVLVQFKDSTMTTWDSMPVATLTHSAMAIDSVQVGGFGAENLLRFAESDGSLVNVSPLNNAQYTELVALVNGTSNRYIKGGSTGAALPSVGATPSTIPAAGQIWFNSSSSQLQYSTGSSVLSVGTSGGSVTSVATGAGLTGGPITSSGTIALATIGAGGTGTKVTYDTYGRVMATTALAESDLPTIAAAGKVSGAAITSGAIAGSTSMNTSGDLTTTGVVTAATVTATHVKSRDLQLFDSGTNQISVLAPSTLSAPYSLTLPATAGTAGYVLSTNGSGVLSWVAASTGSVTSVTATAPLASSAGATPNITIAKATASQDGYLAQTDFAAFNAKQSSTLSDSQIWVGNGSNVAVGVSVSGDIALSNTGSVTVNGVKGVGVSASPTTSGQVLRYNGTAWAPNYVAMSDLRSTITGAQAVTSCGAGQTLTYTSVTDNLSCTSIAINDAQITYASRSANLVFAAPNGSAGAPTYRSLVPADLPLAFANGGNSFAGVATIGTNDAFDFTLKTNGAARLTVTTAGQVGVGTTAPNAALEVAGSLKIGDGAETCATTLAGALRFNSSSIQFCNGSAWTSLAAAGSGLTALTGDVTASGSGSVAATVNSVGGSSAASLHAAELAANAATPANSASTIIKRDASGNFAAGAVTLTSATVGSLVYKDSGSNTIALSAPTAVTSSYVLKWPTAAASVAGQVLASDTSGNLSWFTLPTALSPTGAAGGDLSGTYPNPSVATVGASTAADIHSAELLANAATSANTSNALIKRDGTGNFSANSATFNSVSLTNAGSTVNLVNPVGAAYTLTLPTGTGTSGQLLATNGSGVLSWAAAPVSSQWTTQAGGISYASGNVGIGTTSPTVTLDVNGTILGRTMVNSGSSGQNGSFNVFTNTGSLAGTMGGSSNGMSLSATAAGKYMAFFTNGSSLTERMRIDSAGNVGIGTTGPNFLLDVGASGVAGQIMNFGNGTISQSNYIGTNYRGYFGYNGTTANAVVQGSVGKGIEFNVNNGTFGSGNAMKIDQTGRVGLATTSPAALLHLASTNAANFGAGQTNQGGALFGIGNAISDPVTGLTIASGGSGTGSTIGWNFSIIGTNTYYDVASDSLKRNSTSGGFKDAIAITMSSDSNRGGGNRFSVHTGNQGDPVERLSVTTSGNVGIGTTAPQAKLDVNGQIKGAFVSHASLNTDWTAANIQQTSVAPGTLTFTAGSMFNGANYTLILTSAGTFTLGTNADITTWRCVPGCASNQISASGHTVLTIIKAGTTGYVSWVAGF